MCMFKRIIFLIISLFLALPVLADDGSIIPVLWLFNDLNIERVYELNDPAGSVNSLNDIVKTFKKSGNSVYELNKPDGSVNSLNDIIRTFKID